MDATAWSIIYLARQDAHSQPWFRHLDFGKVGEEATKRLFWAPSYEKIHSEYIPIPLALRRDPQTIRCYYQLGAKQKRKQVERYASFDNDQGYYERLYQTGADSTIPSLPSWPCSGATIGRIAESKQITDDRKETYIFGYKHLVREGMVAKAKLLHPDHFSWNNKAYGNPRYKTFVHQ